MTRKRVHFDITQFQLKSDPESGQLSGDLTNIGVRLTQIWVIFRAKFAISGSSLTPELSMTPMDPFRVTFDPGVFRV